ncbi:MAG: hypothetical protein QG578_1638, partial [Thermodesulfobacteriota bacterium]|nr:hypothetical protein [Thermodesulfobacteriota bacterium]
DKVVQQNAANAEESASASEEMNAQAQEMKFFVEELVTLIGGHTNGNSADKVSEVRSLLPEAREKARLTLKNRKPAAVASKDADPKKLIPMGDEEFRDF